MSNSIVDCGHAATDLSRCVYVSRMTGSVIVAYPGGGSSMLYVGRGSTPARLATHLKTWLHDLHPLGNAVGVGLRICIPGVRPGPRRPT